MSQEVVLSVKNLSKFYELRKRQKLSFKEELLQIFKRGGATAASAHASETQIAALDGVNFELRRGEILGVIGENGAGKSTLLKILSQITAPSHGEIRLSGRLASIIEIGTGFHLELSGRENVYLSGGLMGMNRARIDELIPAIIEFSGIGKFIDLPVKLYSSGMFIRLAFAVVSHLDAEIILLDEVIAVGDSTFRIKSLERIRKLTKSGKTVIIVSHDLNAIANLCTCCLVLEKGRVKAFGKAVDLVGGYLENTLVKMAAEEREKEEESAEESTDDSDYLQQLPLDRRRRWVGEDRLGNEHIRIEMIQLISSHGDGSPMMDEAISIELEYEKMTVEPLMLSFLLFYQLNIPVCSVTPFRSGEHAEIVESNDPGKYRVKCDFPKQFFNRGLFTVDLIFVNTSNEAVFHAPKLLNFKLDFQQDPKAQFVYDGNFPGPLFPQMNWHVSKIGLG